MKKRTVLLYKNTVLLWKSPTVLLYSMTVLLYNKWPYYYIINDRIIIGVDRIIMKQRTVLL